MEELKNIPLKELTQEKHKLAANIAKRLTVEKTVGCDVEYRTETRRHQTTMMKLLNEIDDRFDELTKVRELGYEYGEDVIDRGEATAVRDEDGNIIIEKFSTGIEPIDDELLNGGFIYGSLVSLAGSTNAGKSDIAYMMIRSAVKQKQMIHLHSYELGYADLFRTFGSSQKNKLKVDLRDDEYRKLFSIDQKAMDSKLLIRMIEERAVDGCRIFILDSLTKIKTKEGSATKDNVIEVIESLRLIAKTEGLLIIIIAQKDKQSKIDNRNELFGSIHQEHTLDYMLFVGYEDMENIETSERIISMTKNREDETKKSIITDYDPVSHTIFLKRQVSTVEQTSEKISNWANRIVQ